MNFEVEEKIKKKKFFFGLTLFENNVPYVSLACVDPVR